MLVLLLLRRVLAGQADLSKGHEGEIAHGEGGPPCRCSTSHSG